MRVDKTKVAWLLLIALAFDQASKFWVLQNFVWGETYSLLPGVSLLLVGNKGVSFSLLNQAHPYLLSVLTFALMLGFVVAFFMTQHRASLWAYGLIVAGALGNLVDRIRLGVVVDFILLHYNQFYWPVFNLADVYICLAASILVYDSLRNQQKSRNNS